MLMYYIYILYSVKSDKYYIGYTQDIYRRIDEHNNIKFNTFTHKHRPWEVYALFQVSDNKAEAIKLERFIKKQKSRSLILQLVDSDFIPSGKLAQLVRVPYVRD